MTRIEPVFRAVLLRAVIKLFIVVMLWVLVSAVLQATAEPTVHITFTFTCPGGAPIGTCGA